MADNVTTIDVPYGSCRRCKALVDLVRTALPTVARNGKLVVKGHCQECDAEISTFYNPTPISQLPEYGLPTVQQALIAIGQRDGFDKAATVAREEREDLMLRLQEELHLTHGVLARIADCKRGQVAVALAAARRRKTIMEEV